MTGSGELRLELETVLSADRQRVFTLLTDPQDIVRWWGPHGFTTPAIDLDLHVGGTYRFTMQPPEGEIFHVRGVFTEIVPEERIAYTFNWEEPDPDDVETVVTLTLADAGTRCALAFSQGVFKTEARLELHRGGWSDGFERMAAALSSL